MRDRSPAGSGSGRSGRFSAESKAEDTLRGINFGYAISGVARKLIFGATPLKCVDSSGVIFARLVCQGGGVNDDENGPASDG